MKYALTIVAVLAVMTASSAMAEDGRVSKTLLSSLGLAGLQEVSDEAGMEVRGQGAIVFAFSFAQLAVDGPLPFIEPGNDAAATAVGFLAGADLSTNSGTAGVITQANNGVPILGVLNDGAAAGTQVFWSY